jgi:hypothetical protein
MANSVIWRRLRQMRYTAPNRVRKGERRDLYQASLEQSEQFMRAAEDADYATRPVHLFYALSQASRALVAASPLIGHHEWRVQGHGLSSNTNSKTLGEVTVEPDKDGLFVSLAQALGVKPLAAGETTPLSVLWPVIPETLHTPLDGEATHSGLLFYADGILPAGPHRSATVYWLRKPAVEAHGQDVASFQQFLAGYPSLRAATAQLDPYGKPLIQDVDGVFRVLLEWDERRLATPLLTDDPRSVEAMTYDGSDDWVVTPAVGSMTSPLHPMLAWWAVLLALSTLARYEPATWSQMININSSGVASSVEHLLDQALKKIPAMVAAGLEGMFDH